MNNVIVDHNIYCFIIATISFLCCLVISWEDFPADKKNEAMHAFTMKIKCTNVINIWIPGTFTIQSEGVRLSGYLYRTKQNIYTCSVSGLLIL